METSEQIGGVMVLACSGCVAAATAVVYVAGVAVPVVTLVCNKMKNKRRSK